MRIPDLEYASRTEAAHIVGIVLIAALLNGRLTAKHEAKIDQILAGAKCRETDMIVSKTSNW